MARGCAARHHRRLLTVLDLLKAGSNIAARMAMIAMTTSNSINVNAVTDWRAFISLE